MPPTDPPVPLSATFETNTVSITFDRAVQLIDAAETPPWTVPGRTVGGVSQPSPNVIDVLSTGIPAATEISYAPPPAAVVGDPDGTPVAPFASFPVT